MVLRRAVDMLDIPLILEGGTLLGAIRDGDFCEDDWWDVDLTTMVGAECRADLCDRAERQGWEVLRTDHKWRPEKHRTAVIKIRRDDVKVDVFFKRVKGRKAWWSRGKLIRAVDARHYLEPTPTKVYGGEFLVPWMADKYLTARYGDWRTPVHHNDYDFRTDPCRVAGYHAI